MNIGNPSAGKSPAMDAVMAPLRALDARVREHAEAELARWQEDAEVAALHQEEWQKKVRKAVKDGTLAAAAPRCGVGRAARSPPVRERRNGGATRRHPGLATNSVTAPGNVEPGLQSLGFEFRLWGR